MEEGYDIGPVVEQLHSLANANLGWRKAINEWIDNAWDAGATTVSIKPGPRSAGGNAYLIVEDDGRGTEHMLAFVQQGRHVSAGGSIGRYGIGSKSAALWAGQVASYFSVTSIHLGTRRTLSLCWQELIERGTWRIPLESVVCEDAAIQEAGTSITIRPVRRFLAGKDLEALVRDLGFRYFPALERGGAITVAGQLVAPFIGPRSNSITEATVHVGDRTAHVVAGVVDDGVNNPYPGIAYVSGPRVIQHGHDGCGDGNAARVFGVVRLGDGWDLTTYKDGIEDAEDLYAAVEEAIRPVLEAADAAGHSIELAAVAAEIEQTVAGMVGMRAKRAFRGRDRAARGVDETGTGSGHKDAAKKQPGGPMAGGAGSQTISVGLSHEGEDRPIVTWVPGKTVSRRFSLNLDHPWVQTMRHANNINALALAVVVARQSLVVERTPQLKFDQEHGERSYSGAVVGGVSELLRGAMRFDGQAIAAE